ncbi:AI-2E family transporter [Neorhizobium galegae]|uniref:Putative membrane protein n=1 Tax=Neorhizobium galegae bv. orientalis str. HAMBI 540 TaxID=1028800 RepID=A0A068SPJ5_NEOGA|nr:AI-2E family transporter [Neorhizobium galegae]CDN48153.1 Putative membrane protein [Neorhizobium galegae bv. orientalis str. HAMBI 540]CDZ46502.1 Protein YdiK [Neorhizobium galegae bv. orientalis]
MPLQRVSFYVLLVLVTIAFVAVVLPFYSAILWAVVLAIIFFPLHLRMEALLGRRKNAAAALSVLICLCVVIIPGLVVLSSLVQQGNLLYQRIDNGEIDVRRFFQELQEALPLFVRSWLERIELDSFGALQDRISPALMQGGGFFAGRALSLGQNTLQFFVTFGVMLYLLFFVFRDGQLLARTVRRALPLSDAHTLRFASKFTAVIHATVRGNIIIAIIQGSIGGVAFWFLGVEPALLWGVLMSFLSLLPAVGAALIWMPAAVYLVLAGFWLKAIVLVAVGALVIGLVDNLLRPPLVGRETKLPDYVVLISTIGGISLVGINGFVIGPLVAALFIAAWGIFVEEEGTSDA